MKSVVMSDVLVGKIVQRQKGKEYVYPTVRLESGVFRGLIGKKLSRVIIEFEDEIPVVADGTVMVPGPVD